jgi:phosphonoacetaldehyde hydrolase
MNKIQAVIFDWSGTTIDYGSRAPMGVFVKVFAHFGIDITIAEARGPMGLPKWHHIRALLERPRIATAWESAQGTPADDAAATQIYKHFVPANIAVAAASATLIPGTSATVAALRKRHIRIGSTTGYTRDIMEEILPVAEAQGYKPDTLVCAGDVPQGRPSPLMMYRCLLDLQAYPAWACVKVDDTTPGISEGLAAGCWTVGVSLSGNNMGYSQAELAELSPDAYEKQHAIAVETLIGAGAHYVIDSIDHLLPVIDAIEERLTQGERP